MKRRVIYLTIAICLLSGCSTIVRPTSPENLGILIGNYARHDNEVAFKNLFMEERQKNTTDIFQKLKRSATSSSGHEQIFYERLTFEDGKHYLVAFAPSLEKSGEYDIIKIIELNEEQIELLNSIWEE